MENIDLAAESLDRSLTNCSNGYPIDKSQHGWDINTTACGLLEVIGGMGQKIEVRTCSDMAQGVEL
jgi:hypothetical protein